MTLQEKINKIALEQNKKIDEEGKKLGITEENAHLWVLERKQPDVSMEVKEGGYSISSVLEYKFRLMNREEKIEKIYKVIADKEIRVGCAVIVKDISSGEYTLETISSVDWHDKTIDVYGYARTSFYINSCKIIGHPVMIGDVLDWIRGQGLEKIKYDSRGEIHGELILNREKSRKPIEEQSDDCIDFVYGLS